MAVTSSSSCLQGIAENRDIRRARADEALQRLVRNIISVGVVACPRSSLSRRDTGLVTDPIVRFQGDLTTRSRS